MALRDELQRRIDRMAAADLQAHAQRLALAPDLVELAHLAWRLVAGHGLAAGEEAQASILPLHRLERARNAEKARAAAEMSWRFANLHMPDDIKQRAKAWGMEAWATVLWNNAFQAGYREAMRDRAEATAENGFAAHDAGMKEAGNG